MNAWNGSSYFLKLYNIYLNQLLKYANKKIDV